MTETPDPVFAGEMMGPGVTIDPDPGEVTVVSPIAGKVMVLHPHAFVVMGADGVAVLVHLGINTVRLKGQGFEVLTEKGATVKAGDPMVRWDPSTITEDGMSPMVPVVAMERPQGSIPSPAAGAVAVIGEVLFSVAP
jgi:glucose-specific phosphotransferase system IIA component